MNAKNAKRLTAEARCKNKNYAQNVQKLHDEMLAIFCAYKNMRRTRVTRNCCRSK